MKGGRIADWFVVLMTGTTINLHDLRRKIYKTAKSERQKRF